MLPWKYVEDIGAFTLHYLYEKRLKIQSTQKWSCRKIHWTQQFAVNVVGSPMKIIFG